MAMSTAANSAAHAIKKSESAAAKARRAKAFRAESRAIRGLRNNCAALAARY